MKTSNIIIILCLLSTTLSAQSIINRTIPLQSGQKVNLKFDYPHVRVSTWDKNEVAIQCKVNINGGESNDAFSLDVKTSGNTIIIRDEIQNMDKIPHRVTVMIDGQKMVFKNETEWRKFQEESGKGHNSYSQGVDLDITIDVTVPKNTETIVESVYGMVDVPNFTGPLRVQATYGGVDASLVEKSLGELIAETNYGHIYTNMDIKVGKEQIKEEDFHTYVSAKPGIGPKYSFESTYGNVYLRKSN